MDLRKSFFRYIIPSMLAFALSGVYAIADGFFVGNAMGDNALAAINIAYPLTAFLQAAGTGIGMGGAVPYSIYAGQKDPRRSSQYFGTSLLLLAASSLLLTLLFLAASPLVLTLFGASGEIYTLGCEYLRYISLGAVFQILGTGLVPFIRNMGGAVTAMAAMVAGFAVNIVLDYLFVWVFGWGMRGAAIATDAGQAMTFLVCLVFFIAKKKRPVFSLRKNGTQLARQVLGIGLSPFGLTFSPNITLILVNKSAALTGGDPAVTCYATISYISCVVLLLMQGVSDGSQPLISLHYGKGEEGHALAIRKMAYRFATAVSLVCMAALFIFRQDVAALFGASARTGQSVALALPPFILGFFCAAISRVTTAFYYATGKNRQAYLLIFCEPLALLVLLLVLPALAGIWGTWISVPLSQLAAMFLSLFFIWPRRTR